MPASYRSPERFLPELALEPSCEKDYIFRAGVVLPAPPPALTAAAFMERALADPDNTTVIRTFKMRLLPRKGQHRRLCEALDHTRDLYNAALQERIEAYRKAGASRSYINQCTGLTALRQDAEYTVFPTTLQRWPLKKLDLAFAAFFARVKRGEKPGFPRFKGRDWFKSFGFTDRSGWKVDGSRLYMKGVGKVRIHMHRPLPSAPLSCQVRRDCKGWVALLVCEVPVEALPATDTRVGVDMGISSFIALSDGQAVPGFKPGRKAQKEMRRRQRALARCKLGSNRRRKAKERVSRLHRHTADARRTFHHQTAAKLVRENGLIAVEDLNIKAMARGILARDVHDAGWASFITLLMEKAGKAGREVVKVNASHTSQTCPSCGIVKPKALSERVHRCGECGFTADRDVAAARVILHRAVVRPAVAKQRITAA